MINEESGIKTLKEHKSMINEDASLQRERTRITKEEASKFRMSTQRTDMLEAIRINWNPSLNYIVRLSWPNKELMTAQLVIHIFHESYRRPRTSQHITNNPNSTIVSGQTQQHEHTSTNQCHHTLKPKYTW